MRLILLDNYTKQALHVLRIVAGKMGWDVDVFAPGKPICYYSKYIGKFFLSPTPINKKTYFEHFIEIIKAHQYNAFLSFDDDITSILSENESMLKDFFSLEALLPPRASVLVSDSKNKTLELANKLGIPTPVFYIPENSIDIDEISEKITYPVVVKGEKGAGSWNVRYAWNENELRKYYSEISESEKKYGGKPSIQEFIEGTGHLIHVLCYKGEVIRFCDHIKLTQYPPNGGVTAVGETCSSKGVLEHVQTFCRELNWTGLSKFDFIEGKKDGKYKLIELDPRVSASIIIPQVAGTEMVESFCRIIQGETVEPDLTFKEGIKYRFILPREIQYLLRKPSYFYQFLKGFFERNTFSDICLTDFRPTWQNIRTTLYLIKEELFQRGKTKIILSQKMH